MPHGGYGHASQDGTVINSFCMKKKIYIIGAGSVGSATACELARNGKYTVYLHDINTGLALGRVLDISQAVDCSDCIVHSQEITDIVQADLVIITAGSARQKGMSREELFQKNQRIVGSVVTAIAEQEYSNPILIVTNPSETLVYAAKKTHPQLNIFGLGCILDTWRIKRFIAQTLHSSADNIQANVIGMHNNSMIPLINRASVNGIPVSYLLDEETIARIVERTRYAGTEIVNAIGNHSGFFAAGRAIADFSSSILDENYKIYPVSVVCNGEYGFDDVCLALPAVYHNGTMQIIELELNADELELLQACAERMKTSFQNITL